MSLFKQFKMDTNKEQNGIEVKYGANDDGTIPTFTLRRISNSNQVYTKTLERLSAPYRRLLQLGNLDDRTSNRILITTFCEAVLIGWQNVQNIKNELIPYSFDNAMKLLEELPELYEELRTQAATASLYRDETLEREAKNL